MAANIIIISGMHRSGTSLSAGFLHEAGVSIGSHLLAQAGDNAKGFFEDLDFQDFHEKALWRKGHSYLPSPGERFTFSEDERRHAQELIRMRQDRPLWGWKDPRTVLFLDEWDGLLEDAGFFFVYRHPVEVVLSLARRGGNIALYKADELFSIWKDYNERLLEFCRKHRERCLLCHLLGIMESPERFLSLLEERFGLAARTNIFDSFDERMLTRTSLPSWCAAFLDKHWEEMMATYESLQQEADIAHEDDTQGDDETFLAQLLAVATKVHGQYKQDVGILLDHAPPRGAGTSGQVAAHVEQYLALLDSRLFRFFTRLKRRPWLFTMVTGLARLTGKAR